MTPRLTHEAFVNNLHTAFRIRLDDSVIIETELTEISEQQLSARQERFAIVFRGPLEAYLGQGLRCFEHDQLGELDLFIVPISRDDKGFYYEAVFNLLPENN